MKKIIFWAINAIIFVLLFFFAYMNMGGISLNFFGLHLNVPLIVLVLIVFAAGCFVGVFAMVPFILKQLRKNKKTLKQVQEATDIVNLN